MPSAVFSVLETEFLFSIMIIYIIFTSPQHFLLDFLEPTVLFPSHNDISVKDKEDSRVLIIKIDQELYELVLI